MAAMARSILVVDDDPQFRDLAARVLRSLGHDVLAEAGTVQEALARADSLRPQVVLADIGLPDGDGFELAARLLSTTWRPRIVLISSDAEHADAAAHTGAAGFVPKDEFLGPRLQLLIEADEGGPE
jgi:CheY-like chemotaxis protein